MSADALSSFLPDARRTFVDVVKARAQATPDAPALYDVLLEGARSERHPTTFGELDGRSASIATLLLTAGISSGDRVVIAVARPSRFAAAFLAATRIGAVAVPVPPADGLELSRAIEERMQSVLTDCAPRAILADSPRALAIARQIAPSLASFDVAAIDRARGSVDGTREPSLGDVAFLQYTSGSTGRPRGVVVKHANLVDNLRGIATAASFGPEDRCVSWLPLFHDMGLIGALLLGLYLGTPPHLMEPRSFLMRPVAWLDAMSRFRATFTVAPNFAYALVATRVPEASLSGLDLSSVRLFFDGAEPIDAKTIDAFVSRLGPAGVSASAMYPVYGLAEATLAACFPRPGSGARFDPIDREMVASRRIAAPVHASDPSALLVACLGRALPGHRVWIASEDDAALPERAIGEVVIEGPSISSGYHGENAARTSLRTGDLGYLADGELHVVDRVKDLVIVAGRNYSPSDVERAFAGVSGIVPGAAAAFGMRAEGGTEALAIVAAIHPTTWRTSEVMKAEISAAVFERIGLRPARICLVGPGDVPRTSSGKVRRAACRVALEGGQLREAEGLLARAAMKLERWRRRIGAALATSWAGRARATPNGEVTP